MVEVEVEECQEEEEEGVIPDLAHEEVQAMDVVEVGVEVDGNFKEELMFLILFLYGHEGDDEDYGDSEDLNPDDFDIY